MSTTSQSDNESRTQAHPAPSARTNRSNTSGLANHRTRPYPTSLPRNGGGGRLPSGSNDTRPSPLPSPVGIETPLAGHPPTVGTVRHFGRPGAGVIRRWPPAIVPFEITDSDFNPEFVEHLGRSYDLRAPYMDFAEELVQYSVLLYSVLSTRQAVESLIRSRDAAENGTSTSAGIPLSVQARIYPYQNHFKTFVQNKAKEVLMCATLDVYSSLPVRGAPAAGRTLLDQVMDHVREQSDEFKLDYLPVGFISGDLSALASVSTEIRERLKHERGAMRNLLLTMVHEPSGRPITHPVPSLTNLIIDLTQRMIPSVERAAAHAADRRLRSRIAHLRIQTISHYARRGSGETNRQWAIIDEQLVDLRARDPLYRRAFYRLIMQLDNEMFGDTLYADMDVDRIRTPTEDEVLAQMAVMAEERLSAVPSNARSAE
ncbi:uncharacterized protein PGTG_15800 [Puccinia graminis f. sp. tritici CRL 75-36-700-3]|uniref:Uncharacterized protein n=1 Tax=Puccinia graminis f. sp. tritici (strain CRL 75-36-700-3 / race SCCL) TaxID=418459 RepID=E3KZW3_PUCGT|nr:uncharacterized protein PGTG_15800 [Puccinia graminis f. sp. tritici CRL 75-36-700-3]EFP89844.2 hypothetical protein PGTG_15800 [Puccinia graminis f. sp. tritici CRL 75-36-700-3]